jgi:hypothetical protein
VRCMLGRCAALEGVLVMQVKCWTVLPVLCVWCVYCGKCFRQQQMVCVEGRTFFQPVRAMWLPFLVLQVLT